MTLKGKLALVIGLLTICMSGVSQAMIKGIYITQNTLENTDRINSIIIKAKDAGINTFVVDLEKPTKKYAENIQLLKKNNLNYVARITMFPDGGTPAQIADKAYHEKKYNLVKRAIEFGANEIQLDYIRYNTHSGSSHEHAINVHKIIHSFKERLNVPLQIDVFGISSFGEESHIGQNIKMFSQSVDQICPMVYPSHYEPFAQHMATPYETVYNSLESIKEQFDNKVPVKLVPYIELSNYHYPLSRTKKQAYIYAQIKAVQNAKADGWYAWSPNNEYENLFQVLHTYPVQ